MQFIIKHVWWNTIAIIYVILASLMRWRAALSVIVGCVFGMARTIVTPPERAAAVPDEKSSLWVPPGSRKWTWTSIKPGMRTNRRDVMQSTCGLSFGALPTNLKACWSIFFLQHNGQNEKKIANKTRMNQTFGFDPVCNQHLIVTKSWNAKPVDHKT